MDNKQKEDEEWEILQHHPVPGYKTAFYISVVLSVIYLIIAFSAGFGQGGGAH